MQDIQPGCIYLYDRAYSGFALLRAHFEETDNPSGNQTNEGLAATSYFVVRYKKAGGNSPALNDGVDGVLTDEDRAAGIISDRVGFFNSDNARRAGVSKIPLREVVIPYVDNGEQKTVRLITNLLDVSATTIALLYQHRWQVELFFRWFKSFGHFGI